MASRLARVIFAMDTAKALEYLHSQGVAHHDLKSRLRLLHLQNVRALGVRTWYMLGTSID